MEKEIVIQNSKLLINMSYMDREVDYNKWMTWAAEVLSEFLNEKYTYLEDLKISVNVSVISDEEIKEVNKNHRNKDYATDVLSFPLQENVRDQEFDSFNHSLELGDLLIADGVCLKQAQEFKISYEEEFVHLFFHGLLHLLGYDHELSKEEETLMEAHEQDLLRRLSEIKKGL